MKKNLFFVLSIARTKMCDILSHLEKGMTNKEAANKFGVPKNTISIRIKNKKNFSSA